MPVEPDGLGVAFYDDALPEAAIAELKWCAATSSTVKKIRFGAHQELFLRGAAAPKPANQSCWVSYRTRRLASR